MKGQPDFSTAASGAGSATPPVAGLWIALGALALLLALGAAWSADTELAAARASFRSARSAAAAGERRRPAGGGRADAAAALFASQARASARASPPRVLRDLEALQPPGVRLERVALHYGDGVELEVQVLARQAADYDRFLGALERSASFGAVTPGTENRDGEVRSTLTLRYTGRSAP